MISIIVPKSEKNSQQTQIWGSTMQNYQRRSFQKVLASEWQGTKWAKVYFKIEMISFECLHIDNTYALLFFCAYYHKANAFQF